MTELPNQVNQYTNASCDPNPHDIQAGLFTGRSLTPEHIRKYGLEGYAMCNSCNTVGARDLPDMYAQSPRAKPGHT